MNSCYKTSNNKHFKCPPRMDDGRHFTDYRPNCHVNNLIRANNFLLNSYDTRMFLTKNANKLMTLNRTYACQKNCCGPCKAPYNSGTMLDEKNISSCTNNSCTTDLKNHNGIGNGRKYDNSSSCNSWPSSLPVGQLSNCCALTNDLYNYYNHINTKAQGEIFPRNSIPSGGDILSGGDPVAYNF